MASFFDDAVKTIFGQSDASGYVAPKSTDILSGAQSMLPQIGALNLDFAKQQIPLTQVGRDIREARAPGINAIEGGYLGQILSNLNMGNRLPEDVRQEAIRGALQGSAASGFGLSNAGRGLVARDIGLTSEQLGQQRRQEASRALQQVPYESPRGMITPLTALDLQTQQFDAENRQRAIEAGERTANRKAIIQSISQYAELGGSVVGSAFGSAFGTKGYGSILGKAMGGGGGGFSAGAGATYPGADGQVMTSMRASAVDNI